MGLPGLDLKPLLSCAEHFKGLIGELIAVTRENTAVQRELLAELRENPLLSNRG